VPGIFPRELAPCLRGRHRVPWIGDGQQLDEDRLGKRWRRPGDKGRGWYAARPRRIFPARPAGCRAEVEGSWAPTAYPGAWAGSDMRHECAGYHLGRPEPMPRAIYGARWPHITSQPEAQSEAKLFVSSGLQDIGGFRTRWLCGAKALH